MVEVIVRGFTGGGLNNNAQKRHLQVMMVVENKKVKSENTGKALVISFSNDDNLKGFDHDHDDLMVTTIMVHNYVVKRILVHQESSADILYSVVVASMNIQMRDLQPYSRNLIGLFSKHVSIEGIIKLRVTLRTWPLVVNMDVDFLVVNTPNITYNKILRRTFLNEVREIILIPYLLLKFSTPYEVG